MQDLEVVTDSFCHSYLNNIQNLGFHYVSLGLIKAGQKKILGVFTHKQWQDCYREHKWFKYDPLLYSLGKKNCSPIIWSSATVLTKTGSLIMNGRKEVTQTTEGITFMLDDETQESVIALGSKGSPSHLLSKFNVHYDQILENITMIQKILSHE